MSMKRLFAPLMAAALVLSLVVGFAAAQDEESVLVIAFEQEPPNLRPLNSLTFGGIMENFYARDLWEWDENRDIFPVMAAEIPTAETTEDGNTRVVVTLREGMMWSDGTPITTADCEVWHTIRSDRATSASVSRQAYPEIVVDFEIIDDLTFAVTYDGTFPDYLVADERPECRYPGHVFGPMIEDGGTLEDSDYFTGGGDFDGAATVGYGPYVMTEWNIGEGFTLVANENWDGEAPGFDRVVVRFITDDTQMRNAMETGEIDVAFNWSDDLQPEYAAIDGVETFSAPGVYSDALWIRMGETGNDPSRGGDALMNADVRQAIAHAINRELFADLLVNPDIPVPTSWYPSILWPEDLGFLEYNVEGARALLDGAGWTDADGDEPAADAVEANEADCSAVTPRVNDEGIELSGLRFVTTENTLRNNYQLVIQEALNCVGIGTDIQIIPATTLFASYADRGTLTNFEFELAIFANSADALAPTTDRDAYTCEGIPSDENPDGFNGWQFCNPEYDEIDSQIATTLPGPERDELIAQAVQLKWEGFFWHGLRLRNTWFAVNTNVVDVASAQTGVGTLEDNWWNQIEEWQPAS